MTAAGLVRRGAAQPLAPGARDLLIGVVVAALALLVGALLAVSPQLALGAVVLAAAPMLALSPLARLSYLIFGAVLVFQSSSEASAVKAAYLAGFAIALCAAAGSLRRSAPLHPRLPGLIASCLGLAALVALTLPVALLNGTSSLDWARDAFAYLLFATAPVFAVDAALRLRRTVVERIFLTAATLATASFVVTWLARRGFGQLELSRLAFASFLFPIAVVAYSVSRALWPGRWRLVWAAAAAAVTLGMLATATRASLVVIIALSVALAVAPVAPASKLVGLAALAASVSALALLALRGGVFADVVDVPAAVGRLSTITSASTDPSRDFSLLARQAQTRASLELFRSSPLLGHGLGYPIEWEAPRDAFGARFHSTSYLVDSPAGFLAKLGVVGVLAMGAVLVQLARLVVTAEARASAAGTALIAFGVSAAAWSALQTPFDDKGLALAVLLLLALLLHDLRAGPERP